LLRISLHFGAGIFALKIGQASDSKTVLQLLAASCRVPEDFTNQTLISAVCAGAVSETLMLVLDSIEQEKWYSVVEVSQMVGWSEDVVRRWIERGFIEAFVQPGTRNRRKRVYRSVRPIYEGTSEPG
jgi:hypothetical protein